MNPPPEVIAVSHAGGEHCKSASLVRAFDSVAKSVSLQGTTKLASSGDDGANNMGPTCEEVVQSLGLSVSWPASSSWVACVGSTVGSKSGSPEIARAVNAEGPVASASKYPPKITG